MIENTEDGGIYILKDWMPLSGVMTIAESISRDVFGSVQIFARTLR